MTQKVRTLLIFVIVIIMSQNAYPQINNFDCGMQSPRAGANSLIGSPFSGVFKPTRTDISSNPDAAFPILVVFVQFYGEASAPRNTWPSGQPPYFIGDLIANYKSTSSGNFWGFYSSSTEMISSRWAEISRGAFHVISPCDAFSVILPKTAQQYWLDAGRDLALCEQAINRDIWSNLRSQGLTDWRQYDRWKKDGNDFIFCDLGDGDGFVDMIYKVHKSPGVFIYNDTVHSALYNKAGYNCLGIYNSIRDTVDFDHNIIVDYQPWEFGSGVTLSFTGTVDNYLATMSHEHLHLMTYTGGHVTYSNCSYGIGIEYFYSPYDMILNNYMTTTTPTFGQSNSLGDFSSRNTGNGEILRVPIGTNECFLLSYRNKISKWDRVMLGDTAAYRQYEDNTDYGKGLYIYHVDSLKFPGGDISPQDMECADGYWEWEFETRGSVSLVFDCYTSGSHWKIYKKKNVLYTNDASPIFNSNPYGDEISFHHTVSDTTWPCWWGIGKPGTSSCYLGTDRIYTNDTDKYTKSGHIGDRWDPWKPGYNEVFSPYSSPSTAKWNDSTSGIFIYFDTIIGTGAGIKIYRVGVNGSTESSILQATPPSRPMGLNIDRTECEDYRRYPVLTWNHNMEPDMLQGYPSANYKRYKIYRAWNEVDYVPVNYIEIADTLIHKDDNPAYIDYNTYGQCDQGSATINYRLRYKVKAVDNTDWASVYSDFVSMSSYYLNRGGDDGDNFTIGDENLPKKYDLSQNFPNPFNPVTRINYAIPKQGFVTLKIYDIAGREVKTLVNEFRQAGYYTVDFNGTSLASGVYFYRIQSGTYLSVKKMVLIK